MIMMYSDEKGLVKEVQKDSFVEYIRDILTPCGITAIKPMFGGYGVYKESVMIGLIADNEFYFKADVDAAVYFKSCGSEPFMYQTKGKLVKMSYWKVLPEIMDNRQALKQWHELAVKAALKSTKKLKK